MTYEIKTKTKVDFNKVLKYIEEGEIELSNDEISYFIDIFSELGNAIEIYNFSPLLQEEIQKNNVINKLKLKNEYSINYDDEISFISKNFDELIEEYHDQLLSLDPNIISTVLQNNDFKINNENILFKFILELCSISNKYLVLFENVSFINVSPNLIEKFIEIFDFNFITKQLLINIINCLLEIHKNNQELINKTSILDNEKTKLEKINQELNNKIRKMKKKKKYFMTDNFKK